MWFSGPTFLRKPSIQPEPIQSFSLVSPELDAEIRPDVKSYATQLHEKGLSIERFERFSTFDTLQRAVALLIHIARSFKSPNIMDKCRGWHKCELPRSPDELSQAREVIIRAVQRKAFGKEFEALERDKPIPLNSCLRRLNPMLQNDLICIGGRLKNADVEIKQKNPVILPKHNHVSLLFIRHHHTQVKHQGRHLTEGAVRAAGLWILGGKRLINSTLHKCVTCRRLRGRMQEQLMADLPPECLKSCPPFTYVGLDVFGPWHITTRRTRGVQPESKWWAILFCCMSSRAVHIEVIASMDTSSCVNALRRFFAIRGPAKQLRSDCGTNFIGACRELGMSAEQPDTTVQRYLHQQGCSWVFNPPHASHMGGSWERLIGVARRILESMLLEHGTRLTHEVLQGKKVGTPPPPGDFTDRDLLTKQWRQVQALSNMFWRRWRQVYLSTLQGRKKWTKSHQNLQEGDVVLLKDNQVVRNSWPMAIVTKAIPGKDGKVRKDVLVRLHLPLERLKGYCFDGASNMSGRFNGVQAKLKEVCPDSVFVHCANHSLDLVLQEVAREVRLVADTLNFVREVTVIINDSAKRKALYQSLFGAGDVVNLLGLCPTRWCVRVVSLSRLLACYGEMIQTFRSLESDKAVKGDTRAKIAGFLTKATNMRTVFGLFACLTLFTPCEAVARSLQGTKVTALGSMEAGKLLCKQLGTLRQDEIITDLVAKTKQYAERYGLKPPHPVRSSKTPARFRYTQEEEANDQECSEVEVYPNVWKREMFEALDLVRSEVERRFDLVGIQVAAGREQAIIEAAQGKKVDVTSLKLTGFTRERLSHELDILRDICTGREVNTIRDVVSILQTMQPQTRSMLSEVEKLIKLCLCLPISVAASERSFSALRRLKTWLRNTMSQERLTHLAIMNAHSDLLDEIDVSTLIKKCISRTTERRSTFANA
ncbi:unnamed protein product [Leuciscus chuanchicus]